MKESLLEEDVIVIKDLLCGHIDLLDMTKLGLEFV